MKKLFLKRVGAVVLTGMSLFAAAGLWGAYGVDTVFAEGGTAQEGAYAFADEGVVSPASVCTPSMPVIIGDNKSGWYEDYDYFVAYQVKNTDQHATTLWFGKNNTAPNLFKFNDVGYNEIRNLIAVRHDGNSYYPGLYLVTAHCETCGSNSSTNGRIINESKAFEIEGKDLPANHITTKSTGTIPTSFDQTGSVWEHGGNKSNKIKFTIAYHGIILKDQTVGIPVLGYKSTSVTIDGVTFTVRTEPNKVSIKASTAVTCDYYGTVFGCQLA